LQTQVVSLKSLHLQLESRELLHQVLLLLLLLLLLLEKLWVHVMSGKKRSQGKMGCRVLSSESNCRAARLFWW
jgi:hypothetical protein